MTQPASNATNDEGKLAGVNDRAFLDRVACKPIDALSPHEIQRLVFMALAMQERLASIPSATEYISTKGVNMKFRKKPVVIEATQFKAGDASTHEHVNFSEPYVEGESSSVAGKHWVQTLEGPLIVSEGDWIITGVKGEHYPCKPDIFEMTYEPA